MKRWTLLSLIHSRTSLFSFLCLRRRSPRNAADEEPGRLTFRIAKTPGNKIYFRLIDGDDSVLLTSYNFACLGDCLNVIHGIRYSIDFDLDVEFLDDSTYMRFFVTLHEEVIAYSKWYLLPRYALHDMDRVRAEVFKADVVDTSVGVRFFRPVRL